MKNQPLFTQNLSKWGSLQLVDSREFSYLLDPAPFADGAKNSRHHGFKNVWGQMKSAAEQNGFKIKKRKTKPFAESLNTREYFDTPDFALWRKGFLIRVATDYVDDHPEDRCTLVVKENSADDFQRVLQSGLEINKPYTGETGIEENVFIDRESKLDNSLEMAKKINLEPSALGDRTLGDFGKIIPQLLELGLPTDRPLAQHMTYSYDVKPGHVVLTPSLKARIKLELWTRDQNVNPFVGDLSFEVMTDHYDDMAEVHTQAEQFSSSVLGQHCTAIALPDAARWGGSKTRMLLGLSDNAAGATGETHE